MDHERSADVGCADDEGQAAHSVGHDPREGEDSRRIAARGRCDEVEKRTGHGLGAPGCAPAPRWSRTTRAPSPPRPLPPRSCPLRADDEAETQPVDVGPKPVRPATDPIFGLLRDASPPDAAARSRNSAPEAMRTRRRTRRPAHHPCTARTARPPRRRPLREGWTRAATGDGLLIGRRVSACPPRGSGCSTTRALTFSFDRRSTSSARSATATKRDDQQRGTSSELGDLRVALTRRGSGWVAEELGETSCLLCGDFIAERRCVVIDDTGAAHEVDRRIRGVETP
jgi:hypothetical protein